MSDDVKAQIYGAVLKGFMPLIMVSAVLVGCWFVIDRQMITSEKMQTQVVQTVISKLDAVDENVNGLRRDILRLHNPNATEPKE